MKYKYEIWQKEGCDTKIMKYHLPDDEKVPDTELSELIDAYIKRKDVRNLHIECKAVNILYALKGYVKHLVCQYDQYVNVNVTRGGRMLLKKRNKEKRDD